MILRLFSRQLGREAVVLDIGADCGKNTALAGAAFPVARTFAFEPHPANHAELRGVASSLGFEAVRVGRATRRRASESLDDVPQDPRLPSYPPLGPPLGPTVRLRDLYGSLSALLGIGDVYGVMLCEKDGALMRIYKTTGTVGHTCARNFSYIVCD
ncbi:MAG: hypothetical protein O7I42_23525 [Alphaproteobacteria bacterium]|nr:hypothetical protein [Alphaproteobacteria bacterium]